MIGHGNLAKAMGAHTSPRVKCLAIPLRLTVIGSANAEYRSPDWALSPGLSITGAAKYQLTEGVTTRYDQFVATAELELSSPSRPYYGGLFADYRLSPGTAVDDQVNLGAFIRYDLPLVDFTAYVFSHRSVGDPATAMFAGRVRYRIHGSNKIGLEYLSTLENNDYADVTIAYYGSISDSLSFNIGAGRGVVGGPDLQARVELTWQVH